MQILPSRRAFGAFSRLNKVVPLAACVPLQHTPQELFEKLRSSGPCALFESARQHSVTGRYSILAGKPAFMLSARANQIQVQEGKHLRNFEAHPFEALDALLKSRKAVRPKGFPPFIGGGLGIISYDAVRGLERLPRRAENDLNLPDMVFLFCDETIAIDHLEQKLWVIALADPLLGAHAYDHAAERVDRLVQQIAAAGHPLPCSNSPRPSSEQNQVDRSAELRAATGATAPAISPNAIRSTHSRAAFEAMVAKAKLYIAAGDIYQANLSQRFCAASTEDPWSLYKKLTAINPSPFGGYFDAGEFKIVSASPERLFKTAEGWIETRPIAGTRPKGTTLGETARLRNELLLNEKERAEHLMLMDLERNDLGRVSRFGTVQVDDFMGLEEYSHVIHIVSNVRGRLKPQAGFKEIASALFPGGTITGCPKIRCMEIIEELEPFRRQFYTGSMGYLSYSGEMDFNILIRTALVTQGKVYVQAGAGIVADSDPSREYDETLHKAQALLELLGDGVRSCNNTWLRPGMSQCKT